MKNKILLLSSIVISSLSFSQTADEKRQITNGYNHLAIETLEKKFEKELSNNQEKINAYLKKNKNAKKIITINNKNYHIVNIIDGNPIYRTTHNLNSARATRTDFLQSGGGLGLNLAGQNMLIGVWDEEPALPTHIEFQDGSNTTSRVTTPDFVSGNYGSHGTHVSGTIIARGFQNSAKGMAPEADLVSYNWDNDYLEVLNQASFNGLLISNHSYGIPVLNDNGTQNAPTWMMGNYNSDARQWDELAYSTPYYLQVVSAGNDGQSNYTGGTLAGYDKLTAEKNSKNNLVVANANNPTILPGGNLISLLINSSSSQGPSDDGRIKPDIAGDGTQVYSAGSNNNAAYYTSSGTSMSAPNVAGSLLLLQQYYNDLNSEYMKSATLKGLVCHTADDDGGKIGPDPVFGWGLLNSKVAAETILDDSLGDAFIMENSLTDGQTYSLSFTTSSSSPISATICWTDPAGTDQSGASNSSTPALVNDLDLRLISPDGSTTHMPWKLELSNISGSAVTGDNTVDTVENIDIGTATPGTYTLTVEHKGSLTNGSQDYSLILTGADITLSIKDNSFNSFNFWPNPVENVLNFNFNSSNNSDAYITLVDIQGRVVYKNTIAPEGQIISGKIDTQSYAEGSYVLIIKQGDSRINKKIILK